MKKIYTLLMLMTVTLISAQSITFNGCHPLFDNQNFVFVQSGVDGTGRNIYITTPVDGQECSGLGSCEFKILWNQASSRWEFVADTGNGDFVNPNLIYYNTSASTPNPPSLNLGVWVENNSVTTGVCGGALNSGNSSLTGNVQDNVLSTDDFSINTGVSIYPNPANEILNIKSNNPIVSVSVWNIQGQKVSQFEKSTMIDISNLQAGVYVTKIQTETGLKVVNFIKK